MPYSTGAIIIGGDFQGLGIARNLAELGIPIAIVDSGFSIGRLSKYTKQYFTCPTVDRGEDFVRFLEELVVQHDFKNWMLFPTSDRAVFVLANWRERLSQHYLVPTPRWEITKFAYDKKLTHLLADRLDIPTPKTFFPKDLAELKELPLAYPVILKPSVISHFFPIVKKKALVVRDRGELVKYYHYVASIIPSDEIMVQEIIGGGPQNLYSFCSLFRTGEVKAKIMAKRIRQHPMDFGSATTCAFTCNVPELETYAVRLLKEIDYYGLSEVEFMFDQKQGVYKLLEINPRTWGWHTLGARAGVNFSALLFQDMHDERVQVDSYESGVKWVREITDLPIVLKELIGKRMKVRDYFESIRGKKEFAVMSASDPFPFIAELFLAPVMWYKRGFRT